MQADHVEPPATPPPRIYTLHAGLPGGYLGDGTLTPAQPQCPSCKKQIGEHIRYSKIEFVIENYAGEDLLCPRGALLVTEALLRGLSARNITGFAPLKIDISKSEYYDGPDELPTLYYLAILNRRVRNVPIAYDYGDSCSGCGGYVLAFNPSKMSQMFRQGAEGQLHLEVFRDSWDGVDIFDFIDHPEFGISEIFRDVLRHFNCPDTTVIEATWR